MCRLMACPDNMKKGDILDILLDMEIGYRRNVDGFGFVYTDKEKFTCYKTKNSLSESLKKKGPNNIFNFFPEKRSGYSIFHLRASSFHNDVSVKNSHPFLGKDIALVHNGKFEEYQIAKLLLGKDVKYTSTVDSEVALHLLEKVGVKKFSKVIKNSGAYLALERNGSLWAIKTNFTADLKICQLYKNNKNKLFLSSELPRNSGYENEEAKEGWFYFSPDGKLESFKEKEIFTSKSYKSHNSNDYGNGYGTMGWQSQNNIIQNNIKDFCHMD